MTDYAVMTPDKILLVAASNPISACLTASMYLMERNSGFTMLELLPCPQHWSYRIEKPPLPLFRCLSQESLN